MRTALVTVLVLAGAAYTGGDSSHPHFDDKGTLRWQTTLAAAQAQAKKETKLVFIEYGRKL
ncbi:MAG: hypothetical protein OER88_12250 [Planctomycetota bacterium]|nr:hypothetical protein [Planctomycetota bacterium]